MAELTEPFIEKNTELKDFSLSATQAFKQFDNVEAPTNVREDLSKAAVYLKDLKPNMIVTPFQGTCLAVTKDEKKLVFGSREGRLAIVDIAKKTVIMDHDLKDSEIWTIALVNDDKSVITGNESGKIQKFKLEGMVKERDFEGHTDVIKKIAVSPDEKFLYTTSDDLTVREWLINDEKAESKILFTTQSYIYSLDISLDGVHLATNSYSNAVLYNLDTKEIEHEFSDPDSAI